MSLDSALHTATSGLRLTQKQLTQASQNVAKAGVAGYTRKQVDAQSVTYGSGVRAGEATRQIDTALRSQLLAAAGQQGAATLRDGTLAPLAQLQGSPTDASSTAGLVGALNDGFTGLAASPADSGAMSKVLLSAQALAGQLNAVSDAVGSARQQVQDGLRSDVDQANGLLSDIAKLDKLVRGETIAGRSAADLADQRDTAIIQLAGLVGVKPVPAEQGGVTLMLNSGSILPLQEGSTPFALADATVSPSSYHGAPQGTLPGLTLNGEPLDSAHLGGALGEGFALRDTTLPVMQAELDLTAATLAQRLDQQGLRLFTDAGGAPPPDPTTPEGLAASTGFASRIAVNPAVRDSPRLLRDGTHAVPGFTPNPEGGPSGFASLVNRVTTYSFGAERSAGLRHPPIAASGLGPNGRLSAGFAAPARIADYATAVVGSQATVAAAAAGGASQSAALRSQFDGLLQKAEGVDVDSEMANMVTLQNAYAANARVLTAVQSMWDALLSAVR
jgi:flagellar hook-associated protein 1 FlgK